MSEVTFKQTKKFAMTFLIPLHIWKSCSDAEVDNEGDDVLCGFNDNTIRLWLLTKTHFPLW